MTDRELLEKLFPDSAPGEALTKAGSLARLLNMSAAQLAGLTGDRELSERLALLPELARRYFISANEEGETLADRESAADYLAPYFTGVKTEKLVACFLNGRAEVITAQELSSGGEDEVRFDPALLTQRIVTLEAKGVILAHNHPGGFAVPSRQDIEMTRDLAYLTDDVGARLCEHIIFAGWDRRFLSDCPELRGLAYAEN